jgi:hypothetical protein
MRKIGVFLIAIVVCATSLNVAINAREVTANKPSPSFVELVDTPLIDRPVVATAPVSTLSPEEIDKEIAEATQLLKSRPPLASLTSIRLSMFDPQSGQIDFLSLSKDSYLVKDSDIFTNTDKGRSVHLRIVRANGVNTAVTVTDNASNRAFLPLVVEFPIAKDGALKETAYYTSAHPALVSTGEIASGQDYVTTMIDQAAVSLAKAGTRIDPGIVTIAQHLVIVEHTDHKRFLNEDPKALFPEILSLYALNQDDTFNYSVSTAGAGGMIQMIPRTYEAIRQQHPAASLEADFVTGMRDHANALKAMLLYMNDTWNKLQESSDVQDALRNGTATKPELLAAGYNSNPLRLPGYLKSGGTSWRTLIPAETQMYLSIYSSVDNNVQFKETASQNNLSSAVIPAQHGILATLLSLVTSRFAG